MYLRYHTKTLYGNEDKVYAIYKSNFYTYACLLTPNNKVIKLCDSYNLTRNYINKFL